MGRKAIKNGLRELKIRYVENKNKIPKEPLITLTKANSLAVKSASASSEENHETFFEESSDPLNFFSFALSNAVVERVNTYEQMALDIHYTCDILVGKMTAGYVVRIAVYLMSLLIFICSDCSM